MGTWFNGDGLYVKFGADEGTSAHRAGCYGGDVYGCSIVELIVDLVDLTATETILNDSVVLPANAHVIWVETTCVVVATTGTAIDIGLIDQDRTTEIDYDGLLAAFPTAEMAQVGETRRFYETHTVPASMTGTGALVGQEVTNAGYFSGSRTDATAFGAGKVRIKIAYIPRGIDVA